MWGPVANGGSEEGEESIRVWFGVNFKGGGKWCGKDGDRLVQCS